MAPRPPESCEAFLKRLKAALDRGETVVPFGRHHFDRAVCREGGRWRVRALETTVEECEAYLKEHGIFMPEHQEEIAKPRTILFETALFEELVSHLKALSWS